jgi:Homeodomain-like domain
MDWARILAFVTGMVDQELLARNEYLAAENRILKAQLKAKLSDAERATLAEIGHRMGRRVLGEVANVARPDTILSWYRKLVARKFDGSKARRSPGEPRISREIERLIVRMAKENRDWGYDWIAGALANLGYEVCDQTVGNVLQRHALPPAPKRKRTTTWAAFIRIHMALLVGTDFLTAEVLTLRAGDLLRAVFHPSRESPGEHRRDHGSPGRAVDAADRPQRDHGGMRRSARLSLSPARSRIGRVEDWRAGVDRSLCSLLSRPFVCECHTISTMPRFQPPATSNAACGFPRTTLSCLLRLKAYGTYPAGATFGIGRRTR